MQKLHIMNKREATGFLEQVNSQWGSALGYDHIFLDQGERIYAATPDIFPLDDKALRIDSVGLYFAARVKRDLRLSVEGSQIVGKTATLNVIALDDRQIAEWMRGDDIRIEHVDSPYAIVRGGDDFYGCGKVKDGKLLNHFPKSRRVQLILK
jgi:NOL1/NOP2/fmu family ribosome biogenesis protein